MELRENGTIVHDGIAVGEVVPFDETADDGRAILTINLGWARAANLRIVLRDDPQLDKHRRGIFLDR